jgi:hypothetical protein
VISHEWGKDREMLTSSGPYMWSFEETDIKLSKWFGSFLVKDTTENR